MQGKAPPGRTAKMAREVMAMTKRWMGVAAAAVTAALAGAAATARPAAAQPGCRTVQITTTRTASPLVVTPLDAIAFPVPPAAGTSTITRQILVCPPGTVLPSPPFPSVPTVIGAPVLGAPVLGVPVFDSPYLYPAGLPPAAGPYTAPPAPPRPTGPAVVGTAPHDTVADLARDAGRFDRTVVSVTGTAEAVAQTSDAHGSPVTTFRLAAGGASVGVVVWGRAAVRAGDPVRVSGTFYTSTPFAGSSGAPWHDVIEADVLER
jgi:hypothetical protein